MDIGALNCRVTIEQRAAGQDAAGQPNGAWSTLDTVWANIRYESGSESIRANRETSSAQVSIRIRRRLDVTAGMRVTYEGMTFEIKSVLQDHTNKQRTDLVCEVVDG